METVFGEVRVGGAFEDRGAWIKLPSFVLLDAGQNGAYNAIRRSDGGMDFFAWGDKVSAERTELADELKRR